MSSSSSCLVTFRIRYKVNNKIVVCSSIIVKFTFIVCFYIYKEI